MFNNREAIAISDWEHRGFFHNSKSKNCVGALSLLRSVHTVSLSLKSNWSSDFGHAETGSGAKKRVVLRREIFSL